MTDIVIRVENLSKRYRIGGPQARYKTVRETMMDMAMAPARRLRRLGRPAPLEETIWALKDVSFEVKHGEVLGIIGRNGAGKTTLLKILSRITEPTEGRAEIHGRVGSLLEVGTGFHPELTGRENVYLNGAILGMKRAEIDHKFDEIVEFAEIERFLDTPVKRYSSGMYVRLAFAVAAHLEPEILLVDEVLAVGDAAFQKKCLAKMGDVSEEGRTVLFVSHNMSAILRLCEGAVSLDAGTMRNRGRASEVVQSYLSQGATEEAVAEFAPEPDREGQILKIEILNSDGEPSNTHLVDLPFLVRIQYVLTRSIDGCRVGVRIRLPDGFDVLTSSSTDVDGGLWSGGAGVYSALVRVPQRLLSPGRYSLSAFLGQPGVKTLDRHPDIMLFRIHGRAKAYMEPEHGVIATPLEWCLENGRVEKEVTVK